MKSVEKDTEWYNQSCKPCSRPTTWPKLLFEPHLENLYRDRETRYSKFETSNANYKLFSWVAAPIL